MNGWLVVNGFAISKPFTNIFQNLINCAKYNNINLIKKSNMELLCKINCKDKLFENEKKPDFIIFWDKDTKLCTYLESFGIRTFNNSKAINLCDDKSLTYLHLSKYNINMPKTIFAPKTYYNINYNDLDCINYIIDELSFPIIVKECFGSFGLQVYLAYNYDELIKITNTIGNKPFVFQQFIKSSFGVDLRLYVVGNKVISSMKRKNLNGDFRANINNGGISEKYVPNKFEIDLAIKSCKYLGLDFGGVDILLDENEKPILCEVNSNAHFNHINKLNNINVENYIIEHIINQI